MARGIPYRTLVGILAIIIAALCAALLMAGDGAEGTVITVPGDHPTIQAAIDAANQGDTIEVTPQVYSEALTVSKEVTLVQPSGGSIQLDGGILVQAGGRLIMENLTLGCQDVSVEGGGEWFVLDSPSTLYPEDVFVDGNVNWTNSTVYVDGNITVNATGALNVENTTLFINQTGSWEHHIAINGTFNATVGSNVTTNNTGALYQITFYSGAKGVVYDSIVEWSDINVLNATLDVDNSLLQYNSDGLGYNQNSTGSVTNSTFRINLLGLMIEDSSVHVSNNTFAENGQHPNWMFISGVAQLWVKGDCTGTVIRDNNITASTGFDTSGIRFIDANLTIWNNSISSNLASGIYLEGSNVTVYSSNISDNQKSGAHVYNSTANLVNCTIYNSTQWDVNVTSTLDGTSSAVLLNTSFDKGSTYVTGDNATLSAMWYLHVKVVNDTNEPISGASVEVKDILEATVSSGTTGTDGYFNWSVCLEYIQNKAIFWLLTPHRINCTAPPYYPNITGINMNASKEIVVQLLSDIDPPTFGNLTVSRAHAGAGSLLWINFTASEELDEDTLNVTVGGFAATYHSKVELNYTFNYTVLGPGNETEGPAEVNVTANDTLGNQGWNSTTVTLDFTPPTVVLNTPLFIAYTNGTLHINATVTDASRDDSAVWYVWNTTVPASGQLPWERGNWFNCTNDTTTLPEGRYTLTIQATDLAGNVNETEHATVVVDRTPPTSTLTCNHDPSYLSGGDLWVNLATTFNITTTDGDGSGAVQSQFRVWRETAGWTEWMTYLGNFTFCCGLEGRFYVEFHSVDALGQVEPIDSDNNLTFMVDNAAPAIQVNVSSPSSGVYVNSTTEIQLSATDVGCGLHNITYSIWNGTWSAPMEFADNFTLAAQGTNYLELAAFDNLGQWSFANRTFYVDNTPPVTLTLNGTHTYDQYVTNETRITLAAQVDWGAGVVDTNYRLWNGSWSGWQLYTEPLTFSSEGENVLEFYSTDLLDQVEAPRSMTYIVDTIPPDASYDIGEPVHPDFDGSPGSWNITSATVVSLTATDMGAGVNATWCNLSQSGIYYSAPGGLLELDLSALPDGTHRFEYGARDHLGNNVTEGTLTLALDKSPPTTDLIYTLPGPTQGDWCSGSTVFSLVGTDSWSGVSESWYTIDGAFHWGDSFTLIGGNRNITWGSIDNLGQNETGNSRTMYVDNTPPSTVLVGLGGYYYREGYGYYINGDEILDLDSSDDESGVYKSWYMYDGNYRTSSNFMLPPGQTHNLTYGAIDNVGNNGTGGAIVITVDHWYPEASIQPIGPRETVGGDLIVNTSTTFQLNGTDLGAGIDTIWWWLAHESVVRAYTGPFSLNGTGAFTIRYRPLDKVGNNGSIYELKVTVDDTDTDGDGVDDIGDLDDDNDGLDDINEIELGTDPKDNDTDVDGMPDGWELDNALNPLDASDAGGDLDGDGLPNYYEFENATDPQDRDSDHDTIDDLIELQIGFDPNDASDGTGDSDGDGLTNARELELGTNYTRADTDGDGFDDGEEVQEHSDPLDPKSMPGRVEFPAWLVALLIAAIAALVLVMLFMRKRFASDVEEPGESDEGGAPEEAKSPEETGSERTRPKTFKRAVKNKGPAPGVEKNQQSDESRGEPASDEGDSNKDAPERDETETEEGS